MKSKIIQIQFVSFFLIFCMCTTKTSDIKGIKDVISIKLSSMEDLIIDSAFFNLNNIIPLETNEASILGKIDNIYIDNDRLFILDKLSMKIFIFDTNGKYISQIYRIGEGPTEYIQLMDITLNVDNKEIIVLCDRPYKIMYFDYNGKFIREKKVQDLYMQIAYNKGYIYLENAEELNRNGGKQLSVIKNNIETKILYTIDDVNNSLFYKGKSLLKCKENLYFTRRFDNSIYIINGDSISKAFNIDFGRHNIPIKMKEESNNMVLSNICKENEYIYSISDVINDKNFLLFNTNNGIFIYDKINNILKGYKGINIPFLNAYAPYYYPLGNSNQFVCEIDSEFIRLLINKIEEEDLYNNKNYEKVLDIIENMKEDNNPILIIYEFKQ